MGFSSHVRPRRGETDEWLTPPEIIAALGPFDLDPCSPDKRPWPTAAVHYTVWDQGLSQPWFGRVWMNPPYSEFELWMEKISAYRNGIALIFARTDTEAFHRYVWERATALLFLRGRIYFYLPDGTQAKHNGGSPSVLVAYGEYNAERLRTAGIVGAYIELQ